MSKYDFWFETPQKYFLRAKHTVDEQWLTSSQIAEVIEVIFGTVQFVLHKLVIHKYESCFIMNDESLFFHYSWSYFDDEDF